MSNIPKNLNKDLKKGHNTLKDSFHKWRWFILFGILTSISVSLAVLMVFAFVDADEKSIIITNETKVRSFDGTRSLSPGMIKF